MQCSYELVTITWGRWPTQGLQGGFRRFLFSCVELGVSGFSKWRAVKVSISNLPKNQGETGIFVEDDVEIKEKGQEN